jgi:hypothetical protein
MIELFNVENHMLCNSKLRRFTWLMGIYLKGGETNDNE